VNDFLSRAGGIQKRGRLRNMQFGITVDTHISKWDLVRYAEELGYDRAWVPDSQMIWSDCYATLSLAAVHTSRIKIGTGVSIPALASRQ
jgi:5,10-methylenetetrahydromethanopterin reductase